MMKIPWSGKSHEFLKSEIKILSKIIEKGDPLTGGKYLKLFEERLSKYLNLKNVFAVSSAAAALDIIALLCQIKKNDEIIIPAHTYCASAIPFARNGGKIVWSDIDLKTRTVSVDDIIKKITKKTKVIVVVHLYGYALDVRKLKTRLKKKKILIVEDCAQAFGAEVSGRKVGSFGDFACYSFHAQKNMTTLGEGGAIALKNVSLAKKVPGLRHNGHCSFKIKNREYWKPAMGNLDMDLRNKWPYKFTLSEIQCATGFLLLKRVNKLNKMRISRAKYIIQSLSKFKELKFFSEFKKRRHVYHLIPAQVLSKNFNRDDLISILYKKFKIQCVVQYYPLYKYPLFKKMGFGKSYCKNTEFFFNNMISFPFHVWMSNSELVYMVNSIKKAITILNKNFENK